MPDLIKTRLLNDQEEVTQYISLWADCVDYGLSIDDLIKDNGANVFAQELFRSGNQQLEGTISLLLEARPNSRAIESARMATEVFLKAYLASKSGLTETEARRRIGHDLKKALDDCLIVEPQSELQAIRHGLNCFPEIGDRYKGTERTPRELWQAYGVAQFTGTTVVRSLTGRDVRKTMRVG